MENQKKSNVEEELERLRLEREQLELEELRARVDKLKFDKERSQKVHAQVEADLAEAREKERQRQAFCNHRKGGRGMEGLNGRGSDSYFAVIKHKFPQGHIGVICQRCQKMWLPGDAQYDEALGFPTDNEMSEAGQFRIEVIK